MQQQQQQQQQQQRGRAAYAPFGTDLDTPQPTRGRSRVRDATSRTRDPSMKEILSSGMAADETGAHLSHARSSARSKSVGPAPSRVPFGFSTGNDYPPSPPVPVLPAGRSRSRVRGGDSGSMADVFGGATAPAVPPVPSRLFDAYKSHEAPATGMITPPPTSSTTLVANGKDMPTSQLVERVADFKDKITTTNDKLGHLALHRNELEVQVDQLTKERLRLQADAHLASVRIRDLEERLAHSEQLRNISSSVTQQDQSQTVQALKMETVRRSTLERELGALKAEQSRLLLRTQEDREEIRSMSGQLLQTKTQLQESDRKLAQLAGEKDNITLKFQETDKERLQLQQELQELKHKSRVSSTQGDAAQKELHRLQDQLQDERARRAELERALEEERKKREVMESVIKLK
ncbi:hypothetical protein RI367_001187 [Sorochytrium milnesiophthora]